MGQAAPSELGLGVEIRGKRLVPGREGNNVGE